MAAGKRRSSPQREPTDSRGRIRRKIEGASAPRARNVQWWLHDEPHLTIFEDGERIARVTRRQRMQDFYLACLYDDDELASLSGSGADAEFIPQTLSSNIIKRQVDAFVTKIAKNRPKPFPITTGGNYGQQRRARALGRFGEGVLEKVGFWPTREQRLRDGALFGSGFAFNYRVGSEFRHDRVFPWEIEVDPYEAQYGTPRNFRLKRYVDRQELISRYPEQEEAILNSQAKDPFDRWHLGWDETCDLVLVRGVWHLKSGASATDGAFALCVSDATLERAEYKYDYVPLSKFDMLQSLRGYRGQGIAKQLVGLQYEVNAIGLRLQEQGFMTGSYVLVEDGCGIETDTLDNGSLTVVRYRGQKPEWVNPAPWHPAFFEYYLTLRGRLPAEETRLSEMATRGEIPPGVKSGRAIRSWHALDDEAHIPAGRADERDVINTFWQFFDLAEEIHQEGKESALVMQIESRQHGRSELEELDYSAVRLDRGKFVLKVFPTSFLTGGPEDVWDRVKEMVSDGFFSQDEAMMLLDFPDLQRVMNLRTSARRNIERLLEKIRDAEDPEAAYEYPEPAWNLELCKALAIMAYLEAKLDGVDEENLKWILQFSIDAQAEIDKATPAPAPASPAPVPAPAPAGQGSQFIPPAGPIAPEGAVAPTSIPNLPPQG